MPSVTSATPRSARLVRVRGVVQGVGFRPFVHALALRHGLAGWVRNTAHGVEIRIEGDEPSIQAFLASLPTDAPAAAGIAGLEVDVLGATGLAGFAIRASLDAERATTWIAPDLAICDECLSELFDPADFRYGYPYLNCTRCGPRYSIVTALPYDRANTTMSGWPLVGRCAVEYHDASNRRFHAQPVACPSCGPHYALRREGRSVAGDREAIEEAAALLRNGGIVAVKGLGGYHLACDARNPAAVERLRERKFRKEQPFAVMVRDLDEAQGLGRLGHAEAALLTAVARPIVLVDARLELAGVAPGLQELGLMLPYTPLHHLLFAADAPRALVMTSGNRSSEPIAYRDDDALDRLSGLADALLVGERPIARRVDDSVARVTAQGPVLLRRSRGYAPAPVAALPHRIPVLALGADLKNAVTLVVEGQAFVSQHLGDLDQYDALVAFRETIADLLAMYRLRPDQVVVAHDAHPGYHSTAEAERLPAARRVAVQHHRAHLASVLAEREAGDHRVVGIVLDGTGYGDDGSIWGGELFVGSLRQGLERVGGLRPAALVGGDAAARHPVQAAVGFLAQLDALPDLEGGPFRFPPRYRQARALLDRGARVFRTTSAGRLFDTAAALLGFTRSLTFEGQAAIWLEHRARAAGPVDPYPFPFDGELDFRPLLAAVVDDRRAGRPVEAIARAFHEGLAAGLVEAAAALTARHAIDTVVASGGVFQNRLLTERVEHGLAQRGLPLWINRAVPANDGGISLGQAALALASEG